MSFAASVARDLLLTARNSDITFQINLLSENILQLQPLATRLVAVSVGAQPGTPQAQQAQAQQAAIALQSKGLEVTLANLRSQQQAITTEREGVRKAITREVNSSFKGLA